MVMLLFNIIECQFVIAALAGILVSTAAAWGKEYGDKQNPNNKWDWRDILADSIGTLSGVATGGLLWVL